MNERSYTRIAYLFPVFGLIDGDICQIAAERGAEALIFRVPPGDRQVDPKSFIGDPAATIEATLGLGAPRVLARVAAETRVTDPDVVAWGCTSGSFLADADTLASQADAMSSAAGVPATTTSLAVVHALRARGAERVTVITPYVPDMGEPFIRFLGRNGFEVTGHDHCGRANDEQIGHLRADDVLPLARAAWRDGSQAIVIPCTAVRRGDIVQRLQGEFGVPVILANEATIEHALDIARSGA